MNPASGLLAHDLLAERLVNIVLSLRWILIFVLPVFGSSSPGRITFESCIGVACPWSVSAAFNKVSDSLNLAANISSATLDVTACVLPGGSSGTRLPHLTPRSPSSFVSRRMVQVRLSVVRVAPEVRVAPLTTPLPRHALNGCTMATRELDDEVDALAAQSP